MATDRVPALLALDDSERDLRIERDLDLLAVLKHLESPPFAACHFDLRLVKAASGDIRGIEFRTGGEEGDTQGFYIAHNASNELEIYAYNGGSPSGFKISPTGVVTFSGLTILTGEATIDPPSMANGASYTFDVTVTGALAVNNPSVALGVTIDLPAGIFTEFARVDDDGLVRVRYRNLSGGTVNIAEHDVRATVFQF